MMDDEKPQEMGDQEERVWVSKELTKELDCSLWIETRTGNGSGGRVSRSYETQETQATSN